MPAKKRLIERFPEVLPTFLPVLFLLHPHIAVERVIKDIMHLPALRVREFSPFNLCSPPHGAYSVSLWAFSNAFGQRID